MVLNIFDDLSLLIWTRRVVVAKVLLKTHIFDETAVQVEALQLVEELLRHKDAVVLLQLKGMGRCCSELRVHPHRIRVEEVDRRAVILALKRHILVEVGGVTVHHTRVDLLPVQRCYKDNTGLAFQSTDPAVLLCLKRLVDEVDALEYSEGGYVGQIMHEMRQFDVVLESLDLGIRGVPKSLHAQELVVLHGIVDVS